MPEPKSKDIVSRPALHEDLFQRDAEPKMIGKSKDDPECLRQHLAT
jgi:hypothetical protein